VLPYALLYRLGFAPWERRDVADTWRRLLEGTDPPAPGRALDVGCGSGRDAVYLAKHGWSVTAVDSVDKALASARRRAAEAGVAVQWVKGDVAALDLLGLEPGYNLVYDFGCIHGLSDAMVAFRAGRGIVLPRGMDKQDVVALLGNGWDLDDSRSVVTEDMPAFLGRANPTVYRLTPRTAVASASTCA
jgi:SAM-dependent methyltransferase